MHLCLFVCCEENVSQGMWGNVCTSAYLFVCCEENVSMVCDVTCAPLLACLFAVKKMSHGYVR